MLDDAAFAAQWVESRDRARPRGERALRHELAQKGIDQGVVAAVLEDRAADVDPDGVPPDALAAGRLLARHGPSLARVADPRVRRHRAYALLARNGFDPDVCRSAVDLLADPPDED